MSNAWLFGGQGGQQAGMFARWKHLTPVTHNINRASQLLDEDGWAWDTPEALRGTRAVQLSLLVLQTGVAQELRAKGVEPDFAAGHSLGAWSAAVAAGVLRFDDAVRMVDIRSSGMAAAAPAGYGMIAVIGLKEAVLLRIVDKVREAGGEAWVSNLNSPLQITVSGSDESLALVSQYAQDSGAQKVARLKVAVPAHSPMMAATRARLAEEMGEIQTNPPRFPLVANATGRLARTARQVVEDLIISTDQPVRWGRGVDALSERGITQWVQLPPGNQLVGLLPPSEGEVTAWCIDNVGIEDTLIKVGR